MISTKKAIIVRYAEIHLKGKNRGYFEKVLVNNIREKIKEYNCVVTRISGRYIVSEYDEMQEQNIISAITKVCGVYSVSPATQINNASLEDLIDVCKTIKICTNTFRVTVNRANKNFRVNSTECSKILGAAILGVNPDLKVDLFTPDTVVNVDLRENGSAYIFYDIIKGVSGMPVGTSSRGLLLLSGGIDSPVAGYLAIKRGVKLECVYYESPPHTSIEAKNKVIELARKLAVYNNDVKLHVIKFTDIQTAIGNIATKIDGIYGSQEKVNTESFDFASESQKEINRENKNILIYILYNIG